MGIHSGVAMRATKSEFIVANQKPGRSRRAGSAFHLATLVLILAVALFALISASLVTLHTARAETINSTISNPGNPASAGRRAVVTGGYTSEVGPRPLLEFKPAVIRAAMLPDLPKRILPLLGLVLMMASMVTITAHLWRHTGRGVARPRRRKR